MRQNTIAIVSLLTLIGLATSDSRGQVSSKRPSAPKPPPSAADWVGTWVNGDNHIKLEAQDGIILADGHAYYPKLNHDPYPNLGEFEGAARVRGSQLEVIQTGYGELVCHVIMERRKDTLVVVNHDARCGGKNVSFKGSYRRLEDAGRALRTDLNKVVNLPGGKSVKVSHLVRKHLPQNMLMAQAKRILESAGLKVVYPLPPSKLYKVEPGTMMGSRSEPPSTASAICNTSATVTITPEDPGLSSPEVGRVEAVIIRQCL